MTWEADLLGNQFDLNELVEVTKNSDPRIVQTSTGYGLRYEKFDEFSTPEEVERMASEVAELLSGMCRVLFSSHMPIAVAGLTRYLPEGGRQLFDTVKETILARTSFGTTLTSTDGSVTEERQADPVLRWLPIAQRDDCVAKVFRLLNSPQLTWSVLYNIFEVIEHDIGGSKRISEMGWASSAVLNRFKHSANSPLVGGDHSRHGIENTSPPSNPMSLSEARALIDMLVHGWLNQKR